jgi:hypothetical protein
MVHPPEQFDASEAILDAAAAPVLQIVGLVLERGDRKRCAIYAIKSGYVGHSANDRPRLVTHPPLPDLPIAA